MYPVTTTLFNATGLSRHAITPILEAAQSTTVLLITESWLLPLARYLTNWQKFHTYGTLVEHYKNRGAQGIYLLVNPYYKHHIHYLFLSGILLAQYQPSFTITDTLALCLYLPSSLDSHTASKNLPSLSWTARTSKQTIICECLTARLGYYASGRLINPRGNIVYCWIVRNNVIIWKSTLSLRWTHASITSGQ